jgi:hypothetical protein
MRKVLGGGVAGKPSMRAPAAGAVHAQRVTLALVLAVQVVHQRRKKDPEAVQHDLGHVDVGRDRAGVG